MKILATNVYVGPSLYAHFRVIRHQVDIGVLEQWPTALAAYAEAFNTTDGGRPPRRVDLASRRGWSDVRLPDDTDFAVAVVPATREGARDRWYVFSPILRAAASCRCPGPGESAGHRGG